jgi:ABC-2 type transport system ATP-binding protein
VTDSETLIRVENLGKTYGKKLLSKGFRALDGVSIEVGRGRVFGLLGPNGAGKTTLIKILLGLARPTDGKAFLFDEPVGRPHVRRRIGYLPEAHRLPGYLTGRQVVELFGMMCGRDKATLRARMPELLNMVGMAKSADRKIKEYSKGMQQRIGLAQALVHDPDVIFLDEPTDGVDPVGRAAIRRIVEDLKARGMTIFINSHLLMEVERVCDRVVIMDQGKIIREGTIDDFTQRTGSVRFDIDVLPDNLEQLLDGVGSALERRERGFEIRLEDSERDQVIDRLRAAGISIRGLIETRLDLEQAFIETVRGRGQTP